ncbi:MAG: HAD-IA family hydrolase [Solirubrobacterales bacterium]|nr:HAD-IA family hydrolase [Solirubrobacterales bacterium]
MPAADPQPLAPHPADPQPVAPPPTDPQPLAILLDALGTLVALEPPVPRLRGELAARFGLEVTEQEATRAIAAEIAYYRAHLDEGRDDEALRALRRRCAEVLRRALPAAAARLELDPLVEALLASLHFTPFPDVRPALLAARARGQRLVVASNWDVSLVGVLRRLELEPLLDGIVTSAGAGARKPAPAIFEQALAVAGAPASGTIHVGDSLEEDVAGARAAGIEPVLIRRAGGPAVAGVRTIASLSELLAPTAA